MVADWSNRVSRLPQWIELYNPNTTDVDITGHKLFYPTFNRQTRAYEVAPKPIALKITIPARDAVILTPHSVGDTRVLSKVLHEIGSIFTNGTVGDPILPKHINRFRQSYNRYASQVPAEVPYYGLEGDIGSPGFYREAVRAAPALLKKEVLTSSWARLKIAR